MLFVGVATLANAQKSEVAEAKRLWGIFQFSMMQDPDAPKTKPAQQKVRTGPASTDGFDGDGKRDTKVGKTKAASGDGPVSAPKKAEGPKLSFVDRQIASLKEGLSHADKAIVHEKTKDLAEPWVYKALFTSQIALVDTINVQNSLDNEKIAEEAIAKAKSLDVKNDEKDNIATAEANIINALRVRAFSAYGKKDYNTALGYYKTILAKQPDSTTYLYAGVTAQLGKNYPEAIANFKKVISLNGSDSKALYSEIIKMNLENLKDTTAGLASIKEALAKYPDEASFIGAETDIYITTGNIAKSQESLTKLIAKTPNSALYQYLMGDTYYKQALIIQGQRAKLDTKKVKEFDALTAKMVALIDQSLPFYQKALEIDPVYVPSLEVLKQIYGFKGDTAKFDDVKKRLDAIPAKN